MLRDKKDQQRGGGVFATKLHTETHSCCGFEFCGIKFGLCSWVASKAPWRFVSNEGFYRCPSIGDFPINNPHGPIATAFCMLLAVEVRFGLCRAHYIFSITSAGRPFFLKSSVLDHFNHFYPFLMFCFVVCFCIPSHQAEIIFRPYLGPRPHEPQLNKCVARRVARNAAFGVLQGRQTDGNFKVVYLNHEIMTLSLSLSFLLSFF